MQTFIDKYIAQGVQQGLQQGETAVLLRQIERKFGSRASRYADASSKLMPRPC